MVASRSRPVRSAPCAGTSRRCAQRGPEPVQRHCGGLALLEARALVLCGEDFGRTVALDLDTGELRTERFDLQDDRVEDLAVSDDGHVLAVIGSHTASAAVWHLDGTGPITHELGSGPQAALGYDPSGKYLLVSDVLDSTPTPTPGSFDLRVIDAATGATVDDLDGVLSAVWAGDHSRLAAVFADGTGGIYDVERHHRDANAPVALDISPVSAVADASHARLITWDDRGRVRSFGSNGTPTAPSFDLPNPIYTLGVSPDGKTLVTVFVDYGLVAFDVATGEQVAGPVADYVNMAMSPSGDVVANTFDGRLARFDVRTLTSHGERLPSALGHIAALRFNGVGRLLLLTTGDRSFRLVEWGAQTTLGDPIPSPSSLPLNRLFADLRPDNRALALPSDDGVVIWDLDPEVWAERACTARGPRSLRGGVGSLPVRLRGSTRGVCYFALSASMSAGTTLCTSPTMPRSATEKIGASPSLLTAMMLSLFFMPTRCCVAPEMPSAM